MPRRSPRPSSADRYLSVRWLTDIGLLQRPHCSFRETVLTSSCNLTDVSMPKFRIAPTCGSWTNRVASYVRGSDQADVRTAGEVPAVQYTPRLVPAGLLPSRAQDVRPILSCAERLLLVALRCLGSSHCCCVVARPLEEAVATFETLTALPICAGTAALPSLPCDLPPPMAALLRGRCCNVLRECSSLRARRVSRRMPPSISRSHPSHSHSQNFSSSGRERAITPPARGPPILLESQACRQYPSNSLRRLPRPAVLPPSVACMCFVEVLQFDGTLAGWSRELFQLTKLGSATI
ncbi:hypothetical protein PYCCODRAFT_1239232 [Trametes coccinea BRFM310]|uniref:Uncharacterized protein n=1 Tax=Trametes coccinea (strain BRFM310) TaxID=1353009 RepID=A0A1Y2IXT3_TRAC3|nr:hypothetical protein PYCCODRAFT_1239232 [Trametes coccinea BRFM310]